MYARTSRGPPPIGMLLKKDGFAPGTKVERVCHPAASVNASVWIEESRKYCEPVEDGVPVGFAGACERVCERL